MQFNNFGERMSKKKLYSALESVKNKSIPSVIPTGNKSNTTFFIRRTNFDLGPCALADDKQPYTGGKHGARVYAYEVENNKFKKAMSKDISTKNGSFTYKKDGHTHFCNTNWIILWQAYISQVKSNTELKRSVTYFVTENPDYLWMNKLALVEYTGIDDDNHLWEVGQNVRPDTNRDSGLHCPPSYTDASEHDTENDEEECQNHLQEEEQNFRIIRDQGMNPGSKQTGNNKDGQECTGIDVFKCQNPLLQKVRRNFRLDREKRVKLGSKQTGFDEALHNEIDDGECQDHLEVIEDNFRPKRGQGVDHGSKQTVINEDAQESTDIDDGESQRHTRVIGQHFSNNRDHGVNSVSKQTGIKKEAQNYAQKYADEERQSHLRTIRRNFRSKGYQRVSPGSNQTEINENTQEYTGIDEEKFPNHLQEVGQYDRSNRDHGVIPASKQTGVNKDAEIEGKDISENSCKNCVIYLKSYFETSEENKRLKADVEKLKNNRQMEYNQFQEEIRILKEKLKSSQNFPVHEEAKFPCKYNDSEGSIVIKNEPAFAIHETKEDYHCYVCKINFQTKGTLDFHNQSLHGKKKSENLYFASKRKCAEIMETPFVFPLAKILKEDIPANQTMIKNSSGRLDCHILNTQRTRNHKKNKEDSHIFSGKKKNGP